MGEKLDEGKQEFINRVLEFCYYTKMHQIGKDRNYGVYTGLLKAIEERLKIKSPDEGKSKFEHFYFQEKIIDKLNSSNEKIELDEMNEFFENLYKYVLGFSKAEDKTSFTNENTNKCAEKCHITESNLIALLLWIYPEYTLKKRRRKKSFTSDCLIKREAVDVEMVHDSYHYDSWIDDNINECSDWRFFYHSLAIISKDKAGDVKIADMINTYLAHIHSDKKLEDDWSVESLFRLFNTEGQSIRERYRIASYLKVLFDIDYSLPSRWSFIPAVSKDVEGENATTEEYIYYCSNDDSVKDLCRKLFDNYYSRNILEHIKNNVTFYFEEYSDGYNTDWKSCFNEKNNDDSEYDLEAVLIPGNSLKKDIRLDQKYKVADDGYDAVLIYDYIKFNDGEVCNHVHGSKTVRVVKL